MELFALDEHIARLQNIVEHDSDQLAAMVELAWQMRQRGSNAALALVRRAQAQLQLRQHPALHLRLELIQGEIFWLNAQLEAAHEIAAAVLQACQQMPSDKECLLLQADAHWLLAWLHLERGADQLRDQAWQDMRDIALQAQDEVRAEFAQACLGAMQSFREPQQVQHLADQYLAHGIASYPPALRAAICDFLGLQMRLGNNSGNTTGYWLQSFELSQQSGQIRRAIIAACNLGECFSILNDYEATLIWMERALALARRNNWPGSIGATLARTAACMRKLGRLDAAHEMLEEALQVMHPLQGSRNHTSAVLWMADLQIELAQYDKALENYRALQEFAQKQGQRDMQIYARQGLVNALSKLQQPLAALQMAQEALHMGQEQGNILSQVTSLQLLATLYERHAELAPLAPAIERTEVAAGSTAGLSAQTPQLYYLERAYNLAEAIEGNSMSSILLNDIAQAYAKVGNFAAAYEFAQKTIASHSKLHHTAIANRATAIEMQHKAERARLESEHLRQLAQEQAQRAQMLQDANATLANLGAIGQEITAQLDMEAVFLALKRHVKNMLPTSYMALMLCDSEGHSMTSIFRQEGERLLPTLQISIDDHHSYSAQCVRERREIEMMKARGEFNPAQTADASPTLSALFGPLIIGQRILGVMTIQSEQEYVYGERERLIFRSLCAYGAIALANAHAYQQLQEAQQQLVAQEKLAALGSLVAGVAHELNTPLGNSLVAITGMQDQVQQLAQKLQDQSLRISDLQNFIEDTQELASLSMRNVRAAANLVTNFKQIATSRHQQDLYEFNLLQVTQDICATMAGQLQHAGHSVQIDIPDNISLNSFPGAYGQVLTGLLNNALTHAFDQREQGHIGISAKLHKAQRVQICVADNGLGIAEQHVKFIFDPFFTTRLGQGGNGLGLSICYNIVTSLLRGQIQVVSTVGSGTVFTLDLPLQADS